MLQQSTKMLQAEVLSYQDQNSVDANAAGRSDVL
jgi:hypothetical protein